MYKISIYDKCVAVPQRSCNQYLVWPDVGIKHCPIYSKSCPKVCQKIRSKAFQKIAQLVTLSSTKMFCVSFLCHQWGQKSLLAWTGITFILLCSLHIPLVVRLSFWLIPTNLINSLKNIILVSIHTYLEAWIEWSLLGLLNEGMVFEKLWQQS